MATTRKEATKNGFAFDEFFKMPQVDVNAVLDAQRKNVEALIEANRVAFEGYKSAADRQVELVKNTFGEVSEAAGDVFKGKTPEANASKQFELVQDFMRRGVEGAREVAELTAKANQDAFAVIQKRFNDGISEVKDAAK